jgi:hypothetical protein
VEGSWRRKTEVWMGKGSETVGRHTITDRHKEAGREDRRREELEDR